MSNENISPKYRPIIVLGSGRHAKILINILNINRCKILGVVDPNKTIGENFSGTKVLGSDDVIFDYSFKDIELVNAVADLTQRKIRYKLLKKFEDKKYVFAKVIHPSAIIENKVEIGEGTQIMAGAIIQQGVKIGRSCIINTGVIIDHESVIHDYCHLAPGVTLSGDVVVGERTHIGTGASVIDKKKIGQNCIIGAGSIIHKDIPSNLKYIQYRNELSKNLI